MFVYRDPNLSYIVAKRHAFSYKIFKFDNNHYDGYVEILTGVQVDVPVWESVYTKDNLTFGIYMGNVYDITDLTHSDGKE